YAFDRVLGGEACRSKRYDVILKQLAIFKIVPARVAVVDTEVASSMVYWHIADDLRDGDLRVKFPKSWHLWRQPERTDCSCRCYRDIDRLGPIAQLADAV